jgi:squalene-hopene/tetraprenyl-beta-curcumene cyclase
VPLHDIAWDLDRSTALAVDHCLGIQRDSGCWVADPDPRVAETALVSLVLAQSRDATARLAARRGRMWLRGARPQEHHPAAHAFEGALRSLALCEDGEIDLSGPALAGPVLSARGRLLEVLAARAACPVNGGATPEQLRARIARACAEAAGARLKPWSQVELLSARALMEYHCGEVEAAAAAGAEVAGRQAADGSFHQNPISTALAFLALDTVAPGGPAWRSALRNLLDGQHPDGTWRFCSSDVWDTTLTLRSFDGLPGFDPARRERAAQFLYATQNADGGWPFRSGVESDNDTTAAAMIALAGRRVPHGVIERALDYLAERRMQDGLWRTWQFVHDLPVEDVVAHVVTALDRYPGRHHIPTAPARRWLAERWQAGRRWSASWYRGLPYATLEVGSALPGQPVLASAVAALGPKKNPNRGRPV